MQNKFILVFNNVQQEHANFFLDFLGFSWIKIGFNDEWNFPSRSMKVISGNKKDILNIDVRPYVVENLTTLYSNQ